MSEWISQIRRFVPVLQLILLAGLDLVIGYEAILQQSFDKMLENIVSFPELNESRLEGGLWIDSNQRLIMVVKDRDDAAASLSRTQ